VKNVVRGYGFGDTQGYFRHAIKDCNQVTMVRSLLHTNEDSKHVGRETPLLSYLERQGVTLKDLIDTALELFVPHPGVETREKAASIIAEEFEDALSDVNVSCMVVACFRAEEDAKAGLVPCLTKERFMGRPGLVADELLGMTIASYIAGARGVFEFIRFDQNKPGILKKLGPIVNDAIGGLIAGCSSNMYSQALRRSRI
jgi:alpha-ribazole phosphatase CobZ